MEKMPPSKHEVQSYDCHPIPSKSLTFLWDIHDIETNVLTKTQAPRPF